MNGLPYNALHQPLPTSRRCHRDVHNLNAPAFGGRWIGSVLEPASAEADGQQLVRRELELLSRKILTASARAIQLTMPTTTHVTPRL
jgi:hypothetical protein